MKLIVSLSSLLLLLLAACSGGETRTGANLNQSWGKLQRGAPVDPKEAQVFPGGHIRFSAPNDPGGAKIATPVEYLIVKPTKWYGIELRPGNRIYGFKRLQDSGTNDFLLLPKYDHYFYTGIHSFYVREFGKNTYQLADLETGELFDTNFTQVRHYYNGPRQKQYARVLTDTENNSYYLGSDGDAYQLPPLDTRPASEPWAHKTQAVTPLEISGRQRLLVRHREGEKLFYQLYDLQGKSVGPSYPAELIYLHFEQVTANSSILVRVPGAEELFLPIDENGLPVTRENLLGVIPLYSLDFMRIDNSLEREIEQRTWLNTILKWSSGPEGKETYYTLHSGPFHQIQKLLAINPEKQDRFESYQLFASFRQEHNRVAKRSAVIGKVYRSKNYEYLEFLGAPTAVSLGGKTTFSSPQEIIQAALASKVKLDAKAAEVEEERKRKLWAYDNETIRITDPKTGKVTTRKKTLGDRIAEFNRLEQEERASAGRDDGPRSTFQATGLGLRNTDSGLRHIQIRTQQLNNATKYIRSRSRR